MHLVINQSGEDKFSRRINQFTFRRGGNAGSNRFNQLLGIIANGSEITMRFNSNLHVSNIEDGMSEVARFCWEILRSQ